MLEVGTHSIRFVNTIEIDANAKATKRLQLKDRRREKYRVECHAIVMFHNFVSLWCIHDLLLGSIVNISKFQPSAAFGDNDGDAISQTSQHLSCIHALFK